MARRRSSGMAVNLDSLLDAMFNVVGILILVVIIAQLNAGQAVNRMSKQLERLPKVSPDALAEAKQRAEKLKKLLDRLEAKTEGPPPKLEDKRVTLAELRKRMKRLQKLVEMDSALQKKRRTLGAERSKLLEKKKALEKKADAAGARLKRLKAKLAEAEPPEKPPDKVVRLPRPRDAPEGWKPLWVLVANDKLFLYDRQASQRRLRKFMKRLPRREKTADRTAGIPRKAFFKVFRERETSHPHFQLKAEAAGRFNRRPRFEFVPRSDTGIGKDEIEAKWAEVVRDAGSRKRYLRYMVKPDSFDTYLAARRVTDKIGVPAGWEVRPKGWAYHHTLGKKKFRLTQTRAKIEKIRKRLAKRKKKRQNQEKPDIPPPKVDRNVDGVID